MVIALAALAAAVASFPTGFGFGAGYGAGVRIGYDVIYPQIAPFAREVTGGIIDALRTVWSPGGSGATPPIADAPRPDDLGRTNPRSEPSVNLSEVIGDVSNAPADARGRQPDISNAAGERKFVSFSIPNFSNVTGGNRKVSAMLSLSELQNLINSYQNAALKGKNSMVVSAGRRGLAILVSVRRRVFGS